MGHYGGNFDWEKEQHELRMKEEYTSWIKDQLKDKTSAELRDIHTLINHIDDVRGVMELVKELIK